MTVAAADTRFCEQCVSVKPLTEFRRRSRTGPARLNQCRVCRNRAERERRASKRAHCDHRLMAKSLTQLKNERRNDRLELLCRATFRQFGGMQGFVAAWNDFYHQAMEQGEFAAYRCFQSVIRVAQYCDDNRPDLGSMTDEEIEHALMENTKQLIRQHPELAVVAADQIGWTITPLRPVADKDKH